MCDQKVIEVTLEHKYGIHSMRKTLTELQAQGQIDQSTKKLSVNNKEIGFVYYRTGY